MAEVLGCDSGTDPIPLSVSSSELVCDVGGGPIGLSINVKPLNLEVFQPDVPANVVTWQGQPLTWGGEYVTWQ